MTKPSPDAGTLHPAVTLFAQECRAGLLDRREFLTRASALGASAAAAYGLLGLAAPAARAQTPVQGGTLRIQMELKALKDPRLADWSQISNFYRGWLEYLVEYNIDGTFAPVLLERWEVNEDATEYLMYIRQGVSWNNGDPFTAHDVAHNFERWCDGTLEGNSMAGRMAPLMDTETNRLRADAIEILDDHSLRLALSEPDITLIANLADYPAAVVHPSYDGGDLLAAPIGTGPFLPENFEPGLRATLVRNTDHAWWGEGAWLDRIEFTDYGTDGAAWVAAAEADEIDMTYQTTGDFIDIMDALGWTRTEAITAATLAVRFNQEAPEYRDVRVRRALQMAVDNAVVLELGYNDLGEVAENHHVCPIHPEYAELPPPVHDPAAALALLEEAGHAETEFELISLDDDWQAATCDAVAAQLRDAGINVRRTILPGATFWNDWTKYPFSATEWNMRPLGVQTLAIAYRSGVAWNETAFSNAEFDSLLTEAMSIADADQRREVMARIQQILQEEGVLIQPYWRSIYRHSRPNVRGAEMHPTFELHLYKYWLED